jgi:hypothetical protein
MGSVNPALDERRLLHSRLPTGRCPRHRFVGFIYAGMRDDSRPREPSLFKQGEAMIKKAHKRRGTRLRADLVFECLVQKAIRTSLNDRLERRTINHEAETATQRVNAKWQSNTYGQSPKATR